MRDPSLQTILGTMLGALFVGLGAARALYRAIPSVDEPVEVWEDPDALGYVLIKSGEDDLPTCPDHVPANIMELR